MGIFNHKAPDLCLSLRTHKHIWKYPQCKKKVCELHKASGFTICHSVFILKSCYSWSLISSSAHKPPNLVVCLVINSGYELGWLTGTSIFGQATHMQQHPGGRNCFMFGRNDARLDSSIIINAGSMEAPFLVCVLPNYCEQTGIDVLRLKMDVWIRLKCNTELSIGSEKICGHWQLSSPVTRQVGQKAARRSTWRWVGGWRMGQIMH